MKQTARPPPPARTPPPVLRKHTVFITELSPHSQQQMLPQLKHTHTDMVNFSFVLLLSFWCLFNLLLHQFLLELKQMTSKMPNPGLLKPHPPFTSVNQGDKEREKCFFKAAFQQLDMTVSVLKVRAINCPDDAEEGRGAKGHDLGIGLLVGVCIPKKKGRKQLNTLSLCLPHSTHKASSHSKPPAMPHPIE